MTSTTIEPASLLRRLGALIYDSFLIGGTSLLLGGVIGTVISNLVGVYAFSPSSPAARSLLIVELAIAFALFGWFWTHGGQTLGMRAWKLRIVTEHGQALTWQNAFFRFAWALFSWLPLGAGYLIAVFDPEKLTWHDRLSHTRIIKAE